MATIKRTRVQRATSVKVYAAHVNDLIPDAQNPRQSSEARMNLLRLSIARLGFLTPLLRQSSTGLLLSGHQRLTVAKSLGVTHVPVMDVDLDDDAVKGINILANRVSNDFSAFDTGSTAFEKLNLDEVIAAAEELPEHDGTHHAAMKCKEEEITPLLHRHSSEYDQKAALASNAMLRKGIRIPAVVTESGEVVNGIHRLFSARGAGLTKWPVVRIPEKFAHVARMMLNYLSMDYKADGEFRDLLRAGAFRRISNDKGTMPRTYRFWADDCRALLDRDFQAESWARFRDVHGHTILDFGAGLCKVSPLLREKGMDAYDFEPYRFDPDELSDVPSPDYSRKMAREFLKSISNPRLKFDSIFMSAVLNSIPFPKDRIMVLAIVHALCTRATVVYGTCRDIKDFNYEYGGARTPMHFAMDGEPGLRIGDAMRRPKIQKFHTTEEVRFLLGKFWTKVDTWSGGNIIFWRAKHAVSTNLKVLAQSLDFEFDLPYLDKTTMGLAEEAREAFAKRLMVNKL